MTASVISWVADLLWPRRCAGCGAWHEALCKDCAQRLPPAAPTGKTGIHAATLMDDALASRLVWDLKYRNRTELAVPMARLMAQRLAARGIFSTSPLLVPVPLHASRSRERGYNQAELLARGIAQISAMSLVGALVRMRFTESQVTVGSRAARLTNLRGAFRVPSPGSVCDRDVILVDDVSTTGATAAECARTLKAAGARRVFVAVFARG